MDRITRVKLFLTEYKLLCEKYGLVFIESTPSEYANIVGVKGCRDKVCGKCCSRIDLCDYVDGVLYEVDETKGYCNHIDSINEINMSVKVFKDKEDEEGIRVKPYNEMPTFDTNPEVTEEEIKERAKKLGLFQ